jgi:C-terminal processing protease CtpA/Prc
MNNALRSATRDTLLFVPFDIPIYPHRKFKHEGKIALLFDGLSASASVSIASWFIRSGRGATFGEPTMGSVSGTFGNPVQYTLPESGLVVNIASARYFTQNPVRWEAGPLLPDFPVSATLSQFQLNRDSVMDAAVDWFQTEP